MSTPGFFVSRLGIGIMSSRGVGGTRIDAYLLCPLRLCRRSGALNPRLGSAMAIESGALYKQRSSNLLSKTRRFAAK